MNLEWLWRVCFGLNEESFAGTREGAIVGAQFEGRRGSERRRQVRDRGSVVNGELALCCARGDPVAISDLARFGIVLKVGGERTRLVIYR